MCFDVLSSSDFIIILFAYGLTSVLALRALTAVLVFFVFRKLEKKHFQTLRQQYANTVKAGVCVNNVSGSSHFFADDTGLTSNLVRQVRVQHKHKNKTLPGIWV